MIAASNADVGRTETAGTISLAWLAALLAAASVVELAVLRVGTRTAVHVPGIEMVRGPYQVAATLGRFAFFVAVVLLALVLGKLTAASFRRGLRYAGAATALFVLVAAGAAVGIVGSTVMSATVVVAVAVVGISVMRRERLAVAVVVALFLVAYLLTALASASGLGIEGATRAMELLVVAAAIGAWPVIVGHSGIGWWPGRRVGWLGVGAAAVATLALVANRSTTDILLLWNLGLTGALPALLYGLATATTVFCVGWLLHRGQTATAVAIVLVVLGGLGLTSTYQSGLTVAGLALLLYARTTRVLVAPAPAVRREPSPRP